MATTKLKNTWVNKSLWPGTVSLDGRGFLLDGEGKNRVYQRPLTLAMS